MNIQPPKSTEALFFFIAEQIAPQPPKKAIPMPQPLPQTEPESDEEFANLEFTAQQGAKVESEGDDGWVDVGRPDKPTIFDLYLKFNNNLRK